MTTFFSVIKYVPDPIASESINIGVVVFGVGEPIFRFTNNWKRAYTFGKVETSFLREFADEIQNKQLGIFGETRQWNEPSLVKVLSRWNNSIQFTSPRASIKSPVDLLGEVSQLYLGASVTETTNKLRNVHSHRYDRKYALNQTIKMFRDAVNQKYGPAVAKAIVKRKSILVGKISDHDFDVVIENGAPYLAAYAISFRVGEALSLRKDVDAAAFAVEDIRKKSKKIELGIVAVPPSGSSDVYDRAKKTFSKLSIPIVTPLDTKKWVEHAIQKMPYEITA